MVCGGRCWGSVGGGWELCRTGLYWTYWDRLGLYWAYWGCSGQTGAALDILGLCWADWGQRLLLGSGGRPGDHDPRAGGAPQRRPPGRRAGGCWVPVPGAVGTHRGHQPHGAPRGACARGCGPPAPRRTMGTAVGQPWGLGGRAGGPDVGPSPAWPPAHTPPPSPRPLAPVMKQVPRR